LRRGKLFEALGKAQYKRESVIITHYNKPIAMICPIAVPGEVLTDPISSLAPGSLPVKARKQK
jgi:antitoxin (DNA-binding transcriptional repressor) of toxin-antitoxin stability system